MGIDETTACCFRCGDEDTSCQVSLVDERYSESEGWALCARCGKAVRAWIKAGGEEIPGAREGEMMARLRMFEDHAPREGIDWSRVKGEFSDQFLPPKHPDVTESRTDPEPSPKTTADGRSRSPRVASTLPEEYRWSGLE